MRYALGAYFIWGLLPLYLRLLEGIPSLQIVVHRMLWSAAFMLVVLGFSLGRKGFRDVVRASRHASVLLFTAALIGGNWFVYVYAVGHEHVLETSLGYFICPLLLVFLGRVLLKERLDRLQRWAVGFATAGVAVFILKEGTAPFYALYLATSFAIYALIRKQVQISPLIGSTWEMLVLAVVAIVAMRVLSLNGSLVPTTPYQDALLVFSGVATALPLWWFTEAGKRLPLNTIGILQYLAPCFQFLAAVIVFKEPFGVYEAVGFGFIWLAICLYILRLLARR